MEIIIGETGRRVENVYFLEWAWGWEEVKQGTAVLPFMIFQIVYIYKYFFSVR